MGKSLNGKELGKGFSQRKDGRYEARAMVNGVKINLYNMNLAKLKKDFEIEKAKLLKEEKNIRNDLTLKEWYTEWFEKCKSPQLKSEASRRSYDRKTRNTFIKILGDKKIKDISQINIQTAANELIEHYQERTIREALGVMRECFNTAIVNHIVSINPCTCINIVSNNRQRERRVLSNVEQKMFLDETKGSYYEEVYKILLLTGMRIGEFSGLQWEDIDFNKKEIHINRSLSTAYINGKKIEELTTPKTFNGFRTIPFFDGVEECLLSWKKKQEEYRNKMGDRWRAKPELGNLVFTSTVGSPITRYVIVHDIKKVTDNINMKEIQLAIIQGRQPVLFEHIYPHAFRHTFATRCLEKGLEPLFVQKIMGHANYSTTIGYTHILDDFTKTQLVKTNNFLKC